MEATKKVLNNTHYDLKGNGQHLVTLLFDNDLSSKDAIKELYKCGYKPKDLGIVSHQELFNKPCQVLGPSVESNKESIKKAVKGIGQGALIGAVIAGIGIVIYNSSLMPLTDLFLFLFMGAIWGAVIGFLIKQLIPFSQSQYYDHQLIDGNILIQY